MLIKPKLKRTIRRIVVVTGLFSLLMFLVLVVSIPVSIVAKPGDLPVVDVPDVLVIANANVVDVRTGTILPGRQILVEQGRVSHISEGFSGGSLPTIDINGAFVAPGLIDMHVHVHDRKDMVTNLAYGVTAVRNLRGSPAHLRWRKEINGRISRH